MIYDPMSFLIFHIQLRTPDRYLKLLYFSMPKLSGIGTEGIWNRYLYFVLYQKTRTKSE